MFLAKSSLRSWLPLAKTLKLAVWAFSLNFLYDFTLFGIDIHQNMLISLILTSFDHFQFRPTLGMLSSHYLTVCHKQLNVDIKFLLDICIGVFLQTLHILIWYIGIKTGKDLEFYRFRLYQCVPQRQYEEKFFVSGTFIDSLKISKTSVCLCIIFIW